MNQTNDIVPQFVAASSEYCRLIDGVLMLAPRSFLERAQGLLVQLYGLALQLPEVIPTTADVSPDSMTHDEWLMIYERLSGYLGALDVYWMVFDPLDQNDHDSIATPLSADLSEIYQDLRESTLQLGDALPDDELWSARFNFENHWGDHAVNAITAIHSLLYGPHSVTD